MRPNVYKSSQFTTIPPFKPIPPAEKTMPLKPLGYGIAPAFEVGINNSRPLRTSMYSINTIPSFQSLPVSVSKIPTSMKAPYAFKNALQQATNNFEASI